MPLEFGLKDFIDIFLVALMLFYCYKVMKESRSLNVFFGVLIFVVFWLFVSHFSFAIPAADHSATAYKTSCLYFLYIPVRTDTNVKRISSASMIHVGLGFVLAKLHSLKGESSIYQFIASASMGVMKSSNRNSRS